MTSVKYFSKWFREAQRSPLASVLSCGFLSLYMVMKLVDISADAEYIFFGLGSMELCILCAGLGSAFSLIEFFYLFGSRQQDFYYSLPVKKSTIFLSRYVHGICCFFVPLLLTQTILAVYEAANVRRFLPYAGAYLGRSVGAALLVFLAFYHMGILAVTVSGKIITAVALMAVFLLYFQVMIRNIFFWYAQEFYRFFYRIPLFEEEEELLVLTRLAKGLMGTDIYDCQEAWEYMPEGKAVCAAFLWAGLFLLSALLVHRKRKAETTGRVFACGGAERVFEAAMSILAGMWLGMLAADLAQVKEHGAAAAALLVAGGGMAGAWGVHLLIESLVRMPGTSLMRRKLQMCLTGVCAFAAGCIFPGYQTRFDGYLPERSQVTEVAVSVNGIDMRQKEFVRMETGDDSGTEERLLRYSLAQEESIDKGMEWIREVLEGTAKDSGNLSSATVCYRLKGGGRCYRRYPLGQEEIDSFALIYETEEYKRRAYPLAGVEDVKKGQVTWSDGVTEKMLKMSEQDKEELLAAYKEDVAGLRMEMLKTAFPVGQLEIISEVDGIYQEAMVYPFFEKTCRVLEEAGAEVGKSVGDYRITALKVQRSAPAAKGYSGGVNMEFYDKEEDIKKRRGRLIPDRFTVQPALRPVDPYVRTEVQIEEEAVNGGVLVDCYETEEGSAG